MHRGPGGGGEGERVGEGGGSGEGKGVGKYEGEHEGEDEGEGRFVKQTSGILCKNIVSDITVVKCTEDPNVGQTTPRSEKC